MCVVGKEVCCVVWCDDDQKNIGCFFRARKSNLEKISECVEFKFLLKILQDQNMLKLVFNSISSIKICPVEISVFFDSKLLVMISFTFALKGLLVPIASHLGPIEMWGGVILL